MTNWRRRFINACHCPFHFQIDDPIHVIAVEEPSSGSRQKPPDYEAVADAPPSYDDAIKLNPGQLARSVSRSGAGAAQPEVAIPGSVIGVVLAAPVALVEASTLTPPPPYARYVTPCEPPASGAPGMPIAPISTASNLPLLLGTAPLAGLLSGLEYTIIVGSGFGFHDSDVTDTTMTLLTVCCPNGCQTLHPRQSLSPPLLSLSPPPLL
jgi:hypothetical protein